MNRLENMDLYIRLESVVSMFYPKHRSLKRRQAMTKQ
ncbi:hypothetical protein M3Y94_00548700 [Aphelenchoides besseyi]|nr:hypothetical protein M3Y94_00548700 [Aphelenchoides besseyi]